MVAPRALDEEMAAAEKGGEEICIPQVKAFVLPREYVSSRSEWWNAGTRGMAVERLFDAANVMRLDDKYLCLATDIMDQFTYLSDEYLPGTDQPHLSLVAYVSLILAHYTIDADDYDYNKRDWTGLDGPASPDGRAGSDSSGDCFDGWPAFRRRPSAGCIAEADGLSEGDVAACAEGMARPLMAIGQRNNIPATMLSCLRRPMAWES
ncbi:unnamed protein product [Vitrella brassicaformis CCMP3155]|uniref:Uncharacterized protein n=1 Tax=Vitrella brassicaformis (strain CCMP3155) TaxID=1169540 RepID=A0A0G4FZ66_VITBC|nr:unnamed protein product [Vitrella brassicaformis CCMP3155]|eukprot:CEM20915.1 unnamed protein product [Vitrella brassicaformis CCMP3155]